MPDGITMSSFMAMELEAGFLGTAGGRWRCCRSYDVCINDEAAFREYQAAFKAREAKP
jgi:hypothetical protein